MGFLLGTLTQVPLQPPAADQCETRALASAERTTWPPYLAIAGGLTRADRAYSTEDTVVWLTSQEVLKSFTRHRTLISISYHSRCVGTHKVAVPCYNILQHIARVELDGAGPP